ncbi:30S ribosomal protein S10 [Cucumispora dikerogammari]|nr:30S ribosomal protein S10 [Cucumispora dikerogammari]
MYSVKIDTKKHDVENFPSQESQLDVTFKLKSTRKEEIESGLIQMKNFLTNVGVSYTIKDQRKRVGKITTRKGPSGQGTCTFSKYKIMVFSKDITFKASNRVLGQVSAFLRGVGVEANVFMNN